MKTEDRSKRGRRGEGVPFALFPLPLVLSLAPFKILPISFSHFVFLCKFVLKRSLRSENQPKSSLDRISQIVISIRVEGIFLLSQTVIPLYYEEVNVKNGG
jgi:hypothetical protein